MNIAFIVGVGRSGTTLVSAMLGAHHGVDVGYETSVLRRVVLPFPNKPALSLVQDALVQREDLLVAQIARSNTVRDAYLEFLRISEARNMLRVDKDPRLIESIESLISEFGSCKIIHVFRDPRAVLASKKRAAWSAGKSTFHHLVAARYQLICGALAQNKFSSQILTVCYETLVDYPETVCREICDFLNLSFDKNMLHHEKKASEIVSPQEMQWKESVTRPIDRTKKSSWESQLSPFEASAAVTTMPDGSIKSAYKDYHNLRRLEKIGLFIYSFFVIAAVRVLIYKRQK